MANGFNYVITTELKLAPGALNNLLGDIRQLDNQIKGAEGARLNVGLTVNRSTVEVVQRQIGNIPASINVNLRVNEASLADFRRRVQTLISQAQRELAISVAPERPTTNTPTPSARRVGSRLSQQDLQLMSQQAQIERTLAMNARDLAQAELLRARAVQVSNQARMQQLRLDEALLRLQIREEQLTRQRELTRGVQYRTANTISLTRAREEKRAAQQQNGNRRVGSYSVYDLESSLKDPSVDMTTKMQNLQTLIEHNKQLAAEFGQNLTKSFSLVTRNADNSISSLRTMTYEFTKFGEAVQRGDRSIGAMLEHITRSTLFHTVLVAGFFEITKAVAESINTMREFEQEFVKVQGLAQQRSKDDPTSGINSATAESAIFSIGQRYGRDPMKDVMPVYAEILRRRDLAANQDQAKLLTQMIVRQGLVSKGNDANSDEFNEMTKDVIGISSIMFPDWASKGMNPLNQINKFMNQAAMLRNQGVQVDKLMGAIGADLAPLATTKSGTGMSLESLTALVGAFQNHFSEMSDDESANVVKSFITNLSRTGGAGTTEVNRILGIQNSPNISVYDKIEKIRKRLEGGDTAENGELLSALTDGQFGDLAHSIASSGSGGGGTSRTAQIMGMLESLSDYDKFKGLIGGQNYDPNAADNVARNSTGTLTGLIGKLNAAFQQLAVTVGDTGLLDAIKGITKALTGAVDVFNFFLSPFAEIHKTLMGLNKDLGDFATSISAVVLGGTAVKGASVAKNVIFGTGEGGVLGRLAKYLEQRPVAATRPSIDYASILANGAFSLGGGAKLTEAEALALSSGAGGRLTPTESAVTATRREGITPHIINTSRTSGIMNGALNLLGLGAIAGGGGIKGVITGVVEGFSKLLPILTSFGQLLLRLSLWGALIGGAIYGITALNRYMENRQDQKAEGLTKQLHDSSDNRDFLNTTFQNMISARESRTGFKRFLDDGSGKILDMTNALNSRFKGRNFQYDVSSNQLTFNTTDEAGNRVTHTLDVAKSSLTQMKLITGAIGDNLSLQEEAYQKITVHIKDQNEVLKQIKKSTDDMNNAKDYSSVATSLNDIRFGNARGSAGYLYGAMQVSQNTIGSMVNDYSTLVKQRQLLDTQSNFDVGNIVNTGVLLNNSTKKDEIDKAFQSALQQGKIDDFYRQYTVYDSKKDTDVDANGNGILARSAQYATALYEQQKNKDNLASADKNIKDNISLLQEQSQSYRDLYSQYLVASAGLDVLDAAMNRLNNTISASKTNLALALGEDNRIKASAQVYGAMASQTSLYARELQGVSNAMNAIKEAHPNEDFSINALNNPTGGLSPEQDAMNELIKKQDTLKDSYQQSLQALKQQADAIVDLVMNTDKYKSMWDSVNSRIDLSKSIFGQLRDIQTKATIEPAMTQLNQRLFGASFDTGTFNSQNASQRRDSYMSAFEQVAGALATYGDDSNKLNQAIAEIKGDLGSQLKNALIDPFKDIVQNDFSNAVNIQLEASRLFSTEVNTLGQILDSTMSKLNSGNTATTDIVDSAMSRNGVTANYSDFINKASKTYGVDANLIRAVIQQESGGQMYDQTTHRILTSSAGALGLMQLMPDTAKGLGVDPYSPEENIMGGTKYLAGLLSKYGGDATKALQAYNWGSGNLDQYLAGTKTSMPTETQKYAPSVIRYYNQFGGTDINRVLSSTKASDTQVQNNAAQAKLAAQQLQEQMLKGALTEQVNSLSSNGIQFALDKAIREAGFKSSISRNAYDYQTSYFDAINQSRNDIASKRFENNATLQSYNSILSAGGYNASVYDSATQTYVQKWVELTPNMIETYKEQINRLVENTKALDDLDTSLKKQSYDDPRYNTNAAMTKIGDRLQELQDIYTGKNKADGVGGIEWYKIVNDINNMFSNYDTRRKDTESSQTLFDNTGMYYDRLATNRQLLQQYDVGVLQTQQKNIASYISTIVEGTNAWHLAIEDAVNSQQKMIDMENKKADTARQFFELTGKGLDAYINARSYTQSRDYALNSSGLSQAISKAQAGAPDYNSELINLQIISEMHSKLTQQVNDYKDAITGAFQAGALSLGDYIKKLYDLRDIQQENKQAAIDMYSSLGDSIQSNLSDALKSGMEGNFTSGLDFANNLRSTIASSMSSQISNLLLNQSGYGDIINQLKQQIVGSVTNGGTIDFNGIKQLMLGATNQILPVIQQISEATQGMFGIMKNETYNAPNGFKIDSALYDIAKGRTAKDMAAWLPDLRGPVNAAGSPLTSGNTSGNSGIIALPPLSTIPTGISKLGTVTQPIQNIGNGSLGTPFTIDNPVKDILNSIISLQQRYDNNKGPNDPQNAALHAQADALRAELKQLAPDVASAIGDGATGKSLGEISQYMNDNTQALSKFDVKIGDGMNNVSYGITNLNSTTSTKMDSMISGITNVVSAIQGKATTGTNAGSGVNGIYNPSTGTYVSVPVGTTQNGWTYGPDHAWHSTNPTTSAPNTPTTSVGGTIGTVPTGSSGGSSGSNNSSSGVQTYWAPGVGTFQYNPDSGITLPTGAVRKYHTGGIAGVMNFMNSQSLSSNEIGAILQNDETVFQRGQLGSFIDGLMGSVNGTASALNINLSISGDASGIDKDSLNKAVQDGISQAVREMGRQTRLMNLQTRGVSY